MRHKGRTIFAVLVAVLAGGALGAVPALAAGAPSVETKAATNIAETAATLNGAVNPNGAETKYYFEYGTTTSYGKKTAETSAGAGTKTLEESAAITGLAINTTYHFRIVATNTNGTSDGADREFVATPKAGLPEFVLDKGESFPVTLEGSAAGASASLRNSSGNPWAGECTGVNTKGSITGARALTLSVELEHCLTGGAIECNTAGAAKGSEVLSGNASLVYIDKADGELGVLLTQNAIELRCGEEIEHVRGALVIPVTPINTKTSKPILIIRGNGKGIQEYTSYENEKGEKVNAHLEWNVGSGYAAADLQVAGELQLASSKPLTIDF